MADKSEGQRARAEVIPRQRIQSLSDLIFGLALSIGAISLLGGRPANLADLTGSLLGFGWAFVILALVWVRYTRIMSVMPLETSTMVAANLLLLFLVSIEPYLYNLITNSFVLPGASLDSGTTTSLYAADMGAIFLVSAYFLQQLTKEEKKLVPRESLRGYRLMAYGSVGAAVLFLVSIIPLFWTVSIMGTPSRFILWMGTFLLALVRRGVEAKSREHGLEGAAARIDSAGPGATGVRTVQPKFRVPEARFMAAGKQAPTCENGP